MTRKEILEKTIGFDDAIHRIIRLEEENAELKCECRRCVYTDCPCILSDYGKTLNGICDHFKDIFDENVELKEELVAFRLKVEALEGKTPWKDIKDKSEVIGKLIKAKEIIGNLLGLLPVVGECGEEECELLNRAEQFLKDSIE